MTSYPPPPRRPSYPPQSYENGSYSGPGTTPAVNIQQAPPYPPQQSPSYQRPRNASTSSHHSQHSYTGTPAYAGTPASAYGSTPPGAAPGYFPQQPPLQQQPIYENNQFPGQLTPSMAGQPPALHPQEAYAVSAHPNGHRRRTSSGASVASHRSTHSHHSTHSHGSGSHHSHHGDGHGHKEKKLKEVPRATMGDTLVGIWDGIVNLIPTGKR